METFNQEIWRYESKTILDGIDIHPIGDPTKRPDDKTLKRLEEALFTKDLELHGNYMWGSATRIYLAMEHNNELKTTNIRKALAILDNSILNPFEKNDKIREIKGFGPNITTGLLMAYYPYEFSIYNEPARQGILDKLGYPIKNINEF